MTLILFGVGLSSKPPSLFGKKMKISKLIVISVKYGLGLSAVDHDYIEFVCFNVTIGIIKCNVCIKPVIFNFIALLLNTSIIKKVKNC